VKDRNGRNCLGYTTGFCFRKLYRQHERGMIRKRRNRQPDGIESRTVIIWYGINDERNLHLNKEN
jgi:hypothetical protein